ncbi:MAG: hypothetical protein U9N72_06335 [Bacteroidota bacterium]|nr:hypothetical protein [Bacteroidota bacterium]
MRNTCRLLIILIVILIGGENITTAQTSIFDRWKARRIERKMNGEKRKVSQEKKIREPRSVIKAKREQEKREAELRKAYEKSLKENKERHFNIQSEEVRERMKQNEKEIKAREKARRKAIRKAGRKARKKYRKK